MESIDKAVVMAIAKEAIARAGDSKEKALLLGIAEGYRAGYRKACREKEKLNNDRPPEN